MHLKHGAYYLVTSRNGKRSWKSLGRTFSTAFAEYQRLTGGLDETGRRFVDLYLRYLQHDFFLNLAPKTQERYQQALSIIVPVFRDMDVEHIRPADVWTYLEARKAYPDAANTEHGILVKMLRLAVLMGWRDDNPAQDIPYNSTPKRERILTAAEFSAIYLAANEPVQIGMDFGYMLGIRIGDILDMVWEQTGEDVLLVHQSKNKVRGAYAMTEELHALLRRCKGLHGRTILPTPELNILHNRKMKPYTYYGFRAMFRRAVMKAGVDDVTFHDIRRTAITAAAEEGRRPEAFSLHKSARQARDYVVSVPLVTPLRR